MMQAVLTRQPLAAILTPLSPHVAAWFGSHEKKEMPIARLIHRLRFQMQKFYGGRYLGSLGSHGSLSMSTNLNNAHRPKFGSSKRCSQSLKKEIIMSQNKTLPAQTEQTNPALLNLDVELLLKRIAIGGHSGQFLADAFISAYRTKKLFNHSLAELTKLDAEAFRLFHQIINIRHVPGWDDDKLYQIERRIIAIVGGAL